MRVRPSGARRGKARRLEPYAERTAPAAANAGGGMRLARPPPAAARRRGASQPLPPGAPPPANDIRRRPRGAPLTALMHGPLFGPVRSYLEGRDTGRGMTYVFSPHVSAPVLERLVDGLRNALVVVTTWDPADVLSGASDVEAYRACRGRGAALYIAERLHFSLYSAGLSTAIASTAEATEDGMGQGGTLDVSTSVEHLSAGDRLFLEGIRRGARLADDRAYEALAGWASRGGGEAGDALRGRRRPPTLDELAPQPAPGARPFLASALPMTAAVKDLESAYKRIMSGREAARDEADAACAFHDLANYMVGPGLSKGQFRAELARRFFAHPLTAAASEAIGAGSDLDAAREWVESSCEPVPVPGAPDPAARARVLLDWMAELGGGPARMSAARRAA